MTRPIHDTLRYEGLSHEELVGFHFALAIVGEAPDLQPRLLQALNHEVGVGAAPSTGVSQEQLRDALNEHYALPVEEG